MKPIKPIASLVLLVLLLAPSASAQDARTPELQQTATTLQLIASLQSPIDDVRAQSLKNAIYFATLYRDRMDLNAVAGVVRTVYQHDARAENRRLALAALQAIASPHTQRFLTNRVSPEEAAESRAVLASVLRELDPGTLQ